MSQLERSLQWDKNALDDNDDDETERGSATILLTTTMNILPLPVINIVIVSEQKNQISLRKMFFHVYIHKGRCLMHSFTLPLPSKNI